MSTTLGFGLITIIDFLLVLGILHEVAKIIIDKKDYLDKLIKTLERDRKLEEKIESIKNYEITIESRLNKLQERIEEDGR